MNRDDLVELLFGTEPSVADRRLIEEADDDNPFVRHVRAVIGVAPRRYLVRREFAPGAGIGEAVTTLLTREIVYVGTDPDHRGRGWARSLMAGVAEEAATHALTLFLTTHAPDNDCARFFEHFGFENPDMTPDDFYVFALTDEPWPHGLLMQPSVVLPS